MPEDEPSHTFELPPNTFARGLKFLEQARHSKAWDDFLEFASSLRLIFPSRVRELKLDEVKQDLLTFSRAQRQDSIRFYNKQVKILFPEIRGFGGEGIEVSKPEAPHPDQWCEYLAELREVKINYPEIVPVLASEDWKGILESYQDLISQGKFRDAIGLLADVKIISGNLKYDLAEIQVPWTEAQQLLTKLGRNESRHLDFYRLAANLTIVAGGAVSFTPEGISIEPPAPPLRISRPLPERPHL